MKMQLIRLNPNLLQLVSQLHNGGVLPTNYTVILLNLPILLCQLILKSVNLQLTLLTFLDFTRLFQIHLLHCDLHLQLVESLLLDLLLYSFL